jgi:phosphohistidine phosphatase
VIYLVRHGRAEDAHPLGDEARALTAEGRRDFRALAGELGDKLGLEGIATSPLVRATQTAEILAGAATVDRVESRGELASGGGSAVAGLARQLGDGWALVGHNPSLALALAELLGLPEAPSFRKGAIAALEVRAAGKWQLAWVVSPGRKKERSL